MSSSRPNHRATDSIRESSLVRSFTINTPGSVLVEIGNTKVICTASVEHQVPPFLRGRGTGWLTAEYGMLPGCSPQRIDREAARGKQSGRTMEIQRLIGRSLRQAVNLNVLGEQTIRLDCDVLQADGGTRCASITGACVALRDALQVINKLDAFTGWVAAISVGIVGGSHRLDLEYVEDANADCDLNIVVKKDQGFIEIQGTAEQAPFDRHDLDALLKLGEIGTAHMFDLQANAHAK